MAIVCVCVCVSIVGHVSYVVLCVVIIMPRKLVFTFLLLKKRPLQKSTTIQT